MSVRKRGGGWQVRVEPFPNQTVPSKNAAERLERQLKERKALGDLWIDKPASLGEALDRHLERKLQGGRRGTLRPQSLRFVRQNLRPWQPLRDTALPSLRRALVEDHIRARAAIAPVAARNELAELKAVLREEEARGQRVDPGVFTIELGRRQKRIGRALTLDELDALAAHMPERVKRLVLICGTVGLRFTEATRLEDSMVKLEEKIGGKSVPMEKGELLIPSWLNKSGRDKPIDLTRIETRLFREQLLVRPAGTRLVFPTADGGAYSESGFRSVWEKATRGAGLGSTVTLEDGRTRFVPAVRFHDLRHTATSLMCVAGMRPEHVAARRGDSDGGALVLRLYRHLYPQEVREAVDLLDRLVAGERKDTAHEQQ